MLADQFIAYPDTPHAKVSLTTHQEAAYRYLAPKVANSPRFVLHRDATMMVHGIMESSPRRFLDALKVSRMPFPRMWVEFAFQDRADFLKTLEPGRQVDKPDAHQPLRLGYYLESLNDEGTQLRAHPIWSHEDDHISLCFKALEMNLSPEEVTITERDRRTTDIELEEWSPSWKNKKDEVQAGYELQNRMRDIIPPYMDEMWNFIRSKGPLVVRQVEDSAYYDLMSEWRFVFALLTAMNSRNVFDISHETHYDKLNKSRAKKGKPPLLSHRDVRMHLSKVQRNEGFGSTGASRGDMQAHFVRGHFKLRASGLYWWNPFIRGAGGAAVKPNTYQVRA